MKGFNAKSSLVDTKSGFVPGEWNETTFCAHYVCWVTFWKLVLSNWGNFVFETLLYRILDVCGLEFNYSELFKVIEVFRHKKLKKSSICVALVIFGYYKIVTIQNGLKMLWLSELVI